MRINLQRFSFRFAEQVLNSKLTLKQEIEDILLNPGIELHSLSRPQFKFRYQFSYWDQSIKIIQGD
jgi:hypothetical protein